MIQEVLERIYSTVDYLIALVYFVAVVVVVGSILWKILMMVTGCETPLSGSMEPWIHRGALSLYTNYKEGPLRVGDVVAFKVRGVEVPITHRIVRTQENADGTVSFLTKGDNNIEDDRDLWYAADQQWVDRRDVVGRYRFSVPLLGLVFRFLNNCPRIRVFILACSGLYVYTCLQEYSSS